MFTAKTPKIDLLANMFSNRISELENLFDCPTKVYNELVPKGLHIYDIQKIKNFICWNKEMDGSTKAA